MRGMLAGMKGLNWAFNIIVIIMLVLAILPVLPGNFNVVLPGPQSWTVDMDENNITLSSYIRFFNNGVYDIEDLSFVAQLGISNNDTLVDFHSRTMNITTGTWYWMELRFSMALDKIRSQLVSDIIYHGADLKARVHAQGQYMLGLTKFAGDYESTFRIGPLFQDVRWNTTGFHLYSGPGGGQLALPLQFNASSWLGGTPLLLSADLWNGSSYYGHSDYIVNISAFNEPVMEVTLNDSVFDSLQNYEQELTLDLSLDWYGIQSEFVTVYLWTPPGGD